MRRNDRSTLDTLQRVKEFLTQHPLADAPDALGARFTRAHIVGCHDGGLRRLFL